MAKEGVLVLLVDDEEFLRYVLQASLEEASYRVLSTATGETAIRHFNADPTAVRALVVDVDLGRDRLSGWGVARRMRAIRSDLAVIYITGASGGEWLREGVPGSAMLMKPFTSTDLLSALQRLAPV